jgi:CheY-like chemotaxis protein
MEDAALKAGMNDVVGKPFEVPDFIQTVARHTGRWGQV